MEQLSGVYIFQKLLVQKLLVQKLFGTEAIGTEAVGTETIWKLSWSNYLVYITGVLGHLRGAIA